MLRGELIKTGWNDRAIRAQVRIGAWHRVRHGAYVETAHWNALDEAGRHVVLIRAVLLRSCTDLVVSHASGVPVHGGPTWGLDLREVHGTRRDGKAGRREANVRQHRGLILDGDVEERHGLEIFSVTRISLEVTTVASPEAAVVVINHFLRTGATTLQSLRERYEAGIHCWPFTLRTELVLGRVTPACESVGESRFWNFCAAYHVPMPVPQLEVRDPAGQVFRLDFAWPELGVFVEFDGKVKYTDPYHGSDAADVLFREKRREDQIREWTGWLCVRVTWADLADPERLAARIRAAFDRAKKLRGKL